MPSANFSPDKKALIRREYENQALWFFLLLLIFLLAEPFALYLSGMGIPPANAADFSFRVQELRQFARLMQTLILAPILLCALAFLSWSLFGFQVKTQESSLYYSLPISRKKLFLQKISVALVLISAVFALTAAAFMPQLRGQGGEMTAFLSEWSRNWIGFYLSALGCFAAFVLAFSSCGSSFDSYFFCFSLQTMIPMTLYLLLTFIQDSIPEMPQSLWSILLERGRNPLLLFSPCFQLFLPSETWADILWRLLSLLLFGLASTWLFQKRPAERAENRISAMPFFTLFSTCLALPLTVAGGLMWEDILGKSIWVFLPAMALNSLWILAFIYWIGGAFHKKNQSAVWKKWLRSAGILALCLIVLSLGSEVYARSQMSLDAKNIESISLRGSFHPYWEAEGAELSIHAEAEPQRFEALAQILTPQKVYPRRRGFLTPTDPENGPIPQTITLERKGGSRVYVPLNGEEDQALTAFLSRDPEIGWLFGPRMLPFRAQDLEGVELLLHCSSTAEKDRLLRSLQKQKGLSMECYDDGDSKSISFAVKGESFRKMREQWSEKEKDWNFDGQKQEERSSACEALLKRFRKHLGLRETEELPPQMLRVIARPNLSEPPYRELIRLPEYYGERYLPSGHYTETPEAQNSFVYMLDLSQCEDPDLLSWILDTIFPANSGGGKS